MRIRFALSLLCAVACSDDGDRGRYELSNDPATGMDDSGLRFRPADGGRGTAVGSSNAGNPRSGLDASASMDGAILNDNTGDSATPSAFACQSANDCAILNVGSCCGYFPRCARANAIFTAPDCSDGVVSSCGFPTIDSCTCELGQCVSLQAGVRVNYP
jgi:hypothetical protein